MHDFESQFIRKQLPLTNCRTALTKKQRQKQQNGTNIGSKTNNLADILMVEQDEEGI